MTQSLKAIKPEGVISIIGFLGGMSKEQPGFLDCLTNICTVRGVLVGSRLQFEAMNEAVDANGIKPVVDEKVFGLDQLKEAYQYMVRLFSIAFRPLSLRENWRHMSGEFASETSLHSFSFSPSSFPSLFVIKKKKLEID